MNIEELMGSAVNEEKFSASEVINQEITQQEKATSEDSSPETNENENNPSQEGEKETAETPDESADNSEEETESNIPDENNVPFNKHPRFKELIAEKKRLQEENSKLKELEEKQVKLEKMLKEESPEIPEWFKAGFGENEDLARQFAKYNQEQREAIKKEILSEIKRERETESKKQEQYNQIINEALDDLRAKGAIFEKNALLKIAEEYLPTNAQGDIDMDKAYEIYKLVNTKKTTAPIKKAVAKKLADENDVPKTRKKYTGVDWDSIL